MKLFRMHFFVGLLCLVCITQLSRAQQDNKIHIYFDEKKTYQTIQNFAASDAWACQFVGNWPEGKKNAIADWLFSMDTLANGNPKGIGLSLWRYNLGAGSAEQMDSSGIKDEWRRAPLTINAKASKNVRAQNWFLQAAKQRGVRQFLGFFNSPPVQLTINKKAYADSGAGNINSSNYKAFANYTVKAIHEVKRSTGITFDYISPVNEPQWDWSDGGQEGCPYTNPEISNIVKAFSNAFHQNKLNTKLLITESGHLIYLLPASDKKGKDDQVREFFNSSSPNYIGNLPNVSHTIASHSYFSTLPFADAKALRYRLKDSIAQISGLAFWQSEYCILGDNAGEINGDKKDLGIDAALFLAKTAHEDLAFANASAWQWWTAVSAYDYKDGLVYVDKNKNDGNFTDSKMLWVMGNYSRFIRPGMKRISVDTATGGLLVSGYKDTRSAKIVLVIVNEKATEKSVELDNPALSFSPVLWVYTTDATRSLNKDVVVAKSVIIPARSVVTIVMDKFSRR